MLNEKGDTLKTNFHWYIIIDLHIIKVTLNTIAVVTYVPMHVRLPLVLVPEIIAPF